MRMPGLRSRAESVMNTLSESDAVATTIARASRSPARSSRSSESAEPIRYGTSSRNSSGSSEASGSTTTMGTALCRSSSNTACPKRPKPHRMTCPFSPSIVRCIALLPSTSRSRPSSTSPAVVVSR
jgi:hypothetical protein